MVIYHIFDVNSSSCWVKVGWWGESLALL